MAKMRSRWKTNETRKDFFDDKRNGKEDLCWHSYVADLYRLTQNESKKRCSATCTSLQGLKSALPAHTGIEKVLSNAVCIGMQNSESRIKDGKKGAVTILIFKSGLCIVL